MDVIQIVGQTISTLEFKWCQMEHCDVYKVERKIKKKDWKIVYWYVLSDFLTIIIIKVVRN